MTINEIGHSLYHAIWIFKNFNHVFYSQLKDYNKKKIVLPKN